MGFFLILAAIPGFFFSAWIVMMLVGVIAPDLGIQTVGYWTATLITITLWLAVAPLVAASLRKIEGD